MSDTILVVAAHPDDEALGAGGAMARHAARGDQVHILIVAEGITARLGACESPRLAALQASARMAAGAVGAGAPIFLGMPDNRLDGIPLLDIVQAIEAVAARIKPNIVYTHHADDLNNDHGIVHRAVLTAFRPLPGNVLRLIFAFEVPSSTEWASPYGRAFQPNHFVDISDFWPAKRAALQAYESEMRPFPHPRSIEAIHALATWRGSSAGMRQAEAFMILRSIEG